MSQKRLQAYFFLAIFAAAMVLTYFLYRPYLDLIFIAGILAFLMWPVYTRILKFFRGYEPLAAFSTVMLSLILLLLPFAFLAASLVTEAVELFNKVRGQVNFNDVEGTLSKILPPDQAHALAVQASEAVSDLASFVQPIFSSVTASLVAIFSNTVSILFALFLSLLTMYYLLKDGPELKRELLDLSPLSDEDDSAIFSRIRDAVLAVAYGNFVVSIVKGVIGGIVFLILGLPAPVFWGTMIALTNFIPAVGTAIVTVPFIIYLFATGQFWQGMVLAIVSVAVIGLIDNFLTPNLINKRIRIHPILILFSMLGGLSVFGAFGIFFGPVILSVTLALIDIYKKEYRDQISEL